MTFKRATRLGLSLLLSFIFATSAVASPSGNQPPAFPPGSENRSIDISQNESAAPSALEKLAKHDLVETTFHYHAAYIVAREKMRALLDEVGVAEFNLRLDKNKVSFHIENYGVVSFTTIDGQPVGRVKHKESGVSFIFLEKSLVESGSGHLDLYAARQHFDAGADREQEYYDTTNKLRKIREGRDSVFVWLSEADSSVEKIEARPRHPRHSRAWWADWFRATYQKPTGYNVFAGTLAGSTQAAIAAVIGATLTTVAGVSGIGPAAAKVQDTITSWAMTFGQGIEQGLATAIPSFVFGTALGVYSRPFSTWRARGDERARFLKNTAVSVAFYMGIKSLTDGGWHQLNFMTTDPMHNFVAALAVGQFGVNLMVKNMLKEPNYGFADLEASERADQDWLKIKLPRLTKNEAGHWEVKMVEKPFLKRVDWNRSFKFYLPMNTLTVIDQIWFTWWMSEFIKGDAAWYMPWISTVGLIAAIPLSWKLLMKFAHRKYPDSDKTRQFERESHKYLDARVVMGNGIDKLKDWTGGLKRLAGGLIPKGAGTDFVADNQTPKSEARQAKDNALPRQEPAFEGQAYEGINWFRPATNLDCDSRLTGKKAI